MNTSSDIQNAAAQINRLHREVRRLCAESREKLDGALAAAWHAGRLLAEQKQTLRRNAGRGSWLVWLDASFAGGRSTAYRYMRLALETPAPETLHGLSLRQAYFRLGIATEPKTAAQQIHPVQALPESVVLAQKLLRLLRRRQKLSEGCLGDLATLYRQLRAIFEHSPVAQDR
ncbi:DUF3102 domain-containing protein [Termitidicoccus mucosus]|uniref:DUF3102 domain-containing protein n=1 Tax=Termitidicoccus mucosus TaxID=1184151 RepID=A0A178IFN4_9BACT|nr:hypothetical protein AW736_16985 [Opitutaceae bacterium TSB47]